MDLDLQSCARLLQSINSNNLIIRGKQLHLLFLKRGILPAAITTANRLLQMYVRCSHLGDARKLFDEMPQRNCFTWNTMIEGYLKSGKKEESLNMFYLMPHKSDFSWNLIISGFIEAAELNAARKFFEEMPVKNGIAWNSLLHGYARNGQPAEALRLFKEFKSGCFGRCHADKYVLATVIGVCTNLLAIDWGKQIHALVVVEGVEFDPVLGSSIVNMYAKCGDLDSASLVLHSLPNPDDFSLTSLISGYANCGRVDDAKRVFHIRSDPCVAIWNSLIAGYVVNNKALEALLLFGEMRKHGAQEDTSTIASVISACCNLGIHEYGAQVHAHACKIGVTHDLVVASVLVDTYAKCGRPSYACEIFRELNTHDTVLLNSMITVYCSCGRIGDAKQIFRMMPSKSLISWNSMVAGLSQNGYPIEALEIFCEMNKTGLSMDRFSVVSAISTCAYTSSLGLGEQLFARATIIGIESDKIISTSLVDLYCKCGFVNSGRKLFDQMIQYDEAAWNSMLMGYATNGYGIEALQLFSDMRKVDVEPTYITFTAVLTACNHCGLVEEGMKWFQAMKHQYHLDPGIEHYSCMVDLFARVGHHEEAMHLVMNLPFKADASMWSSVLRGCLAHGDMILGKKVMEQITMIDPKNPDAYVQLSSIFASSGDWERSAQVRKFMRTERIQKVPGSSWADL